MNKIKVMDFDLASKIAAGEVVENPASVVKELVENSIDAKATKIDITLIDGGIQLIQIIDNGVGMSKEDLQLAAKEHATSKLLSEYDLFNIATLGFRGEALASIKAVSKLQISSNDGSSHGYNYDTNAEILTSGYESIGTKISVYNLFYNVPARYKYLESSNKELSKIVDIITRFALTNAHISFTLKNNDKVLVNTNGNNNILQVINNTYSLDVVKNMQEINVNDGDFSVKGYISNREVTRSNKKNIYIFINNRLVFNKELSKALIAGYDDYLMEKRYPIAFINITCDYQLIDVNVHPAKLEVRISKLEQLLDLIQQAVVDTFKLKRKEFIEKEAVVQPTLSFEYKLDDTSFDVSENLETELIQEIIPVSNLVINDIEKPIIEKEPLKEKIPVIVQPPIVETVVEEIKEPVYTKVHFQAIGQFDGSYLLAQNEDGLHIIDQHAAMERINYEKKLLKADDITTKQTLVVPIVVSLTLSEKYKVLEVADKLLDIGIEVEECVNNDLLIREIPTWIDLANAQETIDNTIELITQQKNIRVKDITKEKLILASCKMSLKANTRLDIKQQQSILDQLVLTNNYDRCPHGRPIIITRSKYEIEKLFKRIV